MVWVIIIILAVVLDQATKMIVVRNLDYGTMIPVIDGFFYFTHTTNKGAAWGLFQNGRIFFLILTAAAAVVITYVLFKNTNKLLRTALALILGGAMGNFIDRLFKGSVVDFLDFYFGKWYHFPTFNIADSCVVVGTVLLMYFMLFVYKEKEKTEG